MMDHTPSGLILDDETPVTRTFTDSDYVPHWGDNELDRDRDALNDEEAKIANRIGLPTV